MRERKATCSRANDFLRSGPAERPGRGRCPAPQPRSAASPEPQRPANIALLEDGRDVPGHAGIQPEPPGQIEKEPFLEGLDCQRTAGKDPLRRQHDGRGADQAQPPQQQGAKHERRIETAAEVEDVVRRLADEMRQGVEPCEFRRQIHHPGLAHRGPLAGGDAGIRLPVSQIAVQGNDAELELIAERLDHAGDRADRAARLVARQIAAGENQDSDAARHSDAGGPHRGLSQFSRRGECSRSTLSRRYVTTRAD